MLVCALIFATLGVASSAAHATTDIDCGGGSHGAITLSNVSHYTVENCTFTDVTVQFWLSDHVTLYNDTFTSSGTTKLGCEIYFTGGSYNSVLSSYVDGGGHDSTLQHGYDDNVCLQNEDHDLVQQNTLTNTWDAGVEWLSTVNDTTVSDNAFSYNAYTMVGGWHVTPNFNNNAVAANDYSGSLNPSQGLFWVARLSGSGTSRFDGNTFRDNTAAGSLVVGGDFYTQTNWAEATGNLVCHNGGTAPYAEPASGYTISSTCP
jgi:hypothetical protein